MNYNCLGNIFRTNNVQEVTEKIWELIDYDTKKINEMFLYFLAFTFHFCLLARIFLKAIYININRLLLFLLLHINFSVIKIQLDIEILMIIICVCIFSFMFIHYIIKRKELNYTIILNIESFMKFLIYIWASTVMKWNRILQTKKKNQKKANGNFSLFPQKKFPFILQWIYVV